MSRINDEQGIVAFFLIKVILGIALLGLLFIEGGSIIFTRFKVQDVAETGATAGVGQLQAASNNCDVAGEVAAEAVHVKDPDVKVKSYTCHPDGRFTITVQKRANTLVVDRIEFMEDLALARSTATASPAEPGF